jgi:hypothetical protein
MLLIFSSIALLQFSYLAPKTNYTQPLFHSYFSFLLTFPLSLFLAGLVYVRQGFLNNMPKVSFRPDLLKIHQAT